MDPGVSSHVGSGLVNTGPGTITTGQIVFNKYSQQPQQLPTLRESLCFEKIQWRECAIEDAHDGTCSWLLNSAEYKQWSASQRTEPHHGLLWIKGNAGAGKSTIMKFAVEHGRSTPEQGLILPHFFNARGTDALEYSTEGMYRTLLVWLLDELEPGDVEALDKKFGRHSTVAWPVPELERLLKAAVERASASAVTFFVDALDECNVEEVRKMVRVFWHMVRQAWTDGRQIRVCFASRPYPQITFKEAVFVDLKKQEDHNQDIARYIQDWLQIGSGNKAVEIRGQLLAKAEGVFMWAVLVVGRLNDAYDHGNLQELSNLLTDIPAGLHELYQYTLDRYPESRGALLVCFQWLLSGHDSLEADELWWGVQVGLGRSDDAICRDYAELDAEAMERYIVGITKGLVEFKDTEAQFIHESVRDFICSPQSLQELYGVKDGGEFKEFEGRSHEQLRDWCTAEIAARRPDLMQLVERKGRDGVTSKDYWEMISGAPKDGGDNGKRRFALAHYAWAGVWSHAEEAQRCGRDQTRFLDQLPDRIGFYFLALDWFYLTADPIVYSSVISCLIHYHCGQLIAQTQLPAARRARQQGQAFGLIDQGTRFSPLVDIRMDRHTQDGVKALVEIYLQLEPQRHPRLDHLLQDLADCSAAIKVHIKYEPRFGALLDLADVGDSSLATLFLLVLAPPAALEPHLDVLDHLLNSDKSPRTQFLQVLHYFIQHDIRTDAIECTRQDTLVWAAQPRTARRWGNDWEESEEEASARAPIAALLRSRSGLLLTPSTPD